MLSNLSTIEFFEPQMQEPEFDNDEEFLTSIEAYAKNKQVCQYIHCQKESYNGKYYDSTTTDNLVICKACKEYEFKFGTLKRKRQTEKRKPSNGVCQYIHCQKESSNGKWYKSKTNTNLVICQACESYERMYGTLKRKFGHQVRKQKHPISISSYASDINFLNFKPFPKSSSDSANKESPTIKFDNHETKQKEFQIFHLDDEVECRSDDNDVWLPGRVTKLVPLEVQPNEWDYSRQWDDVRKRKFENRASKQKYSSNPVCEYCQEQSSKSYLSQSQTSEFRLCAACKKYEKKNDKLVPRNQRRRPSRKVKTKSEKVCDYCKEHSSSPYLHQSKMSEFKLCFACYRYENRHSKLVPRDQRKNRRTRTIKSTKVCEYCHECSSNPYLFKSTVSKLELCDACKQYEQKNGKLVPRHQRCQRREKKLNVCEYCGGKNSALYLYRSKTSKLQLCAACNQYEKKYKKLVPRNQRIQRHNYWEIKSNQTVCDYIHCQRESSNGKWYQSKTNRDLGICKICERYERQNGTLTRRFGLRASKENHLSKPAVNDINQPFCSVCGSGGDEPAFLLCDHEDAPMHGARYYCMGLSAVPPKEKSWFCPKHTQKKKTPIILKPEMTPLRKDNAVVEKICQSCHQETPNTYLYTCLNVQQNLCEACYQNRYQMTWQISTIQNITTATDKYKRNRETNSTTATDLHREKKKQKIESIFMEEPKIKSTMAMEQMNVPLPPLEKETNIDTDAKESHANFEESNHSSSTTSEQSDVLQRPLAIISPIPQENYYTCHTCSKRALKLYQLKPCDHLMCPQCAFQGLETQCPSCGKKANNCIKMNIS